MSARDGCDVVRDAASSTSQYVITPTYSRAAATAWFLWCGSTSACDDAKLKFCHAQFGPRVARATVAPPYLMPTSDNSAALARLKAAITTVAIIAFWRRYKRHFSPLIDGCLLYTSPSPRD